MDINLNHADIRLDVGQTLQVCDGVGTRIACHDGSVWITQESDLRDVLLDAGEVFTLDRAGMAVVQAMESASIGLDEPLQAKQIAPNQGNPRSRGAALLRSFLYPVAPVRLYSTC